MSRKFSVLLETAAKAPALFLKEDGTRFTKPTTLKLRLGETYHFKITVQPPLSLECVRMQLCDEGQAAEDEGGTELCKCGVTEVQRDQAKAVYEASWLVADLPHCKSGTRETIAFVFAVNLGEVTSRLQCKVYKEASKKHLGGRRLHFLEQPFTISSDNTLCCSQYSLT